MINIKKLQIKELFKSFFSYGFEQIELQQIWLAKYPHKPGIWFSGIYAQGKYLEWTKYQKKFKILAQGYMINKQWIGEYIEHGWDSNYLFKCYIDSQNPKKIINYAETYNDGKIKIKFEVNFNVKTLFLYNWDRVYQKFYSDTIIRHLNLREDITLEQYAKMFNLKIVGNNLW